MTVNDNRVRGIRQRIPSGVVIGRTAKGTGKAQLLNGTALRAIMGPGIVKAQIGSSTLTVKDEGVTKSTVCTTLDFTGALVTAAGAGATVTVTIPGVTIKDEGSTICTGNCTQIDFVGAGVVATAVGGNVTVTIPAGISTSLTNTHILVGNGTGVATDVAMSGDATLANTGAITIANDAVTYAKMQNMTDARLLGRAAGSSGDPQEITVAASLTLASGQLGIAGSGLAADLTAAILADNPTAYWKCNEASGSILDYGPGGFNLTTVASVTYQHSPLLGGDATKYMRITNTTGGAKLTSGLGLTMPLGDVTLECVVLMASVNTASWFGIDGGASALQANNSQAEFGISGSSLTPGMRWENGAGPTNNRINSPSSAVMRNGSPIHIMMVRDNTAKTVTFYFNGRLQEVAQSYANNPDGGGGTMVTYIGATGDNSTSNNVVIGHVAIYAGQKLSAARAYAHALAAGLTGSA